MSAPEPASLLRDLVAYRTVFVAFYPCDGMTMIKRTVLIACSIVAAASAVLVTFCFVPSSRVYSVESRINAAPRDDAEIVNWLKKQPGVVAHTVHVNRNQDSLGLTFVMTQNAWMNPPFPDVEQAALKFGYSIDSSGFQDQRD